MSMNGSKMRDKLREQNQLARMRLGQEVPEDIALPSNPEIHFWQVPVNEAQAQYGLHRAANLDVGENMAGFEARNRVAMESDVWHSLREPGAVDEYAFKSIEEMTELLDPSDISFLAESLNLLMSYGSPSVDGLSEADLDGLKKDFVQTDWSALTGMQWAAVKLCCRVLSQELLAVKLRTTSSTG